MQDIIHVHKHFGFEHFGCVKIKPDYKEDVLKGRMKYYCSECFSKNPSMISTDNPKGRPRLNSLPLLGQGYLFRVTPTTIATVIPSDSTGVQQIQDKREITAVLNCENCDFEIRDQTDLTNHMENNHKFICNQCEVHTKTRIKMEEHIRACHPIPCDMCDTKVLTSKTDLENHKKACHTFPCGKCTKVFPSNSELLEHIKSTHSLACEQCDQTTICQKELDDHIERSHTFLCEVCTEIFDNKIALDEHHGKQHTFKCNHCDASFQSKSDLDEHILATHAFHCTDCGMNLSTKLEMDDHKNSVHMGKQSPTNQTDGSAAGNNIHECIICEIKFITRTELKEHLESEHTFNCEKCSIIFKVKSLLKIHNESMHRFMCSVCKEIKSTQDELTKHMEVSHTFACSVCNMQLTSKGNLELHEKDIHLMCPICSLELRTKDEVEKHIQENHTLHCEVCDFTGMSEDIMEDHILEKHARPDVDNLFKCDDCTFKSTDKNAFGKHYKDMHGSKASNSKSKKQEEELRMLRNNLERLEGMYHESLEEVNKVKSEYEARLIIANDNFTVIKAENEVLKERVDILFKLGRSYIDKSKTNAEKKTETTDEDIEVIEEVVEDTENIENLQGWTKSKMRGFRRVNPASKPDLKEPPRHTNSTFQTSNWY